MRSTGITPVSVNSASDDSDPAQCIRTAQYGTCNRFCEESRSPGQHRPREFGNVATAISGPYVRLPSSFQHDASFHYFSDLPNAKEGVLEGVHATVTR